MAYDDYNPFDSWTTSREKEEYYRQMYSQRGQYAQRVLGVFPPQEVSATVIDYTPQINKTLLLLEDE